MSTYIYNYHSETCEYLDRELASLDPVATKREGRDVYYAPAYATLLQPPSVSNYKVPVFENNTWVVKDDYRNEYACNEVLDVIYIEQIGPMPQGFIHITEGEAMQIAKDPLWYVVQDGELIKNPNYEEQKAAQERERISKLAITKYDFFKYICQPNNIGYQELMQLVNSNDIIAAAWNLCERVYRGDEILNAYISEFFPNITSEQLDEIFERFGK